MAFTPTLAGQKLTAGALNDLALIGATAFAITANSGQSIPTRTAEVTGDAVQWDAPSVDLYGAWSSGAPTRFTTPKAGLWTFEGSIGYNNSVGGSIREAIWYVNNGLLTIGRAVGTASTAIANIALTVAARPVTVALALNDYVELVPLQNSGGPLALATGSLRSFMTATYAGPNS